MLNVELGGASAGGLAQFNIQHSQFKILQLCDPFRVHRARVHVRHSLSLLLACILLSGCGAEAPIPGLKYELVTETEAQNVDPEMLKGLQATIEAAGDNTRMEIVEGDGRIFKSGTVVLTRDGGENVTVLEPEKKQYYEYTAEEYRKSAGGGAMPKIGLADLQLSDVRVFVDPKGRDKKIQGYSTNRYHVGMAFRVRISVAGRSHSARTVVKSRVWTTEEIGEEYYALLRAREVKTGFKEVDDKVAEAAKKVKGFPLRQVVETEIAIGDQAQGITSTSFVRKIEKVSIDPVRFEVPDDFKEVDPPEPPGLLR
jgi:hypothetical protein